MFERYIKRTIFVATCQCGEFRSERMDDPPKEVLCPHCGKWVPFLEQSYVGPELGAKK